jgi:IS4 transposase
MDREADIYELFELACNEHKNAPVVIRAQHNRVLKNSPLKLFDYLQSLPVCGTTTVNVPPQRAKAKTSKNPARPYLKARTADLHITYKKVVIPPPKTSILKGRNPLTLYAVYARETATPEGAEPIKWTLLTTLEIDSFEDASNCVKIYKLRWRIEEFHRVLKTGCKVEKHKQRNTESLKRAIAIDMVIAWRIMLLALLGRECPDLPADLLFSDNELLALNLFVEKKNARE